MERGNKPFGEIVNLTELGLLLRSTRISQGRSMRNVARSAGISVVYLSSLEKGLNRKTNRPSIPSPKVKSKLLSALGIAVDSDNSDLLQNKSVKGLEVSAMLEREKAAKMVRERLISLDNPNNSFSYSIELATLYSSTAVAMQAVVGQLEEKILELKNKYKIEGEMDINSRESKADVLDTQNAKESWERFIKREF